MRIEQRMAGNCLITYEVRTNSDGAEWCYVLRVESV